MPEHRANMYALEQIKASGFNGYVAALAKFQDHVEALEAAGADFAFNAYAEAGAGFAAEIEEEIHNLTGNREGSASSSD